jgi:hypothetical protein
MSTVCPKAEGTTLMGWCTTGQHDSCRISYTYDGTTRRCGCVNHVNPEETK